MATAEIDLRIDEKVFSTPAGGSQDSVIAPPAETAGTATFTTTCWSCKFTCSGCDDSECFC